MNIELLKNHILYIPEMDDEHILHANLLLELRKSIDNNTLSDEILLKVKLSILLHFEHEEAFMLSINFPFLKPHIKEHINFINRLNYILEMIKDLGYIDKIYYAEKLFNELLEHVSKWDIKYSTYIDSFKLLK